MVEQGTIRSEPGGRAQRLERASALIFIGRAVLVADLLVVFFAPAAFRVGSRTAFLTIMAVLAAIGVALLLSGYSIRRKLRSSQAEE